MSYEDDLLEEEGIFMRKEYRRKAWLLDDGIALTGYVCKKKFYPNNKKCGFSYQKVSKRDVGNSIFFEFDDIVRTGIGSFKVIVNDEITIYKNVHSNIGRFIPGNNARIKNGKEYDNCTGLILNRIKDIATIVLHSTQSNGISGEDILVDCRVEDLVPYAVQLKRMSIYE